MAVNLFYFLAFVTLLSGIMVVVSKNPVHSVLYLILTFFSISAHYVLLNAQFLAAVNVIVYAGAIMVLFLFVIMFLNLKGQVEASAPLLIRLASVVAVGVLLVVVVGVIKETDATTLSASATGLYDPSTGFVQTLGKTLFQKFLVPFELASVLFLAALVGAVLLGKREEGESNSF